VTMPNAASRGDCSRGPPRRQLPRCSCHLASARPVATNRHRRSATFAGGVSLPMFGPVRVLWPTRGDASIKSGRRGNPARLQVAGVADRRFCDQPTAPLRRGLVIAPAPFPHFVRILV
jgi:hypothetical protein